MSGPSLKTYLEKRNFSATPEPSDRDASVSDRPVFVIQEHDASTLHYDFRLEIDGVLASWAVPKGPSVDPREKRLAIRTEDHPLSYADFEGVIPEGQYGAGTVLVWDRGSYRNLMAEKDPPREMSRALAAGHIEVWLEGQKVRGGYALVRAEMKNADDETWLLIKMSDEGADARRNPVSTQPRSVLSGATLDEICKAGEHGDDDDG